MTRKPLEDNDQVESEINRFRHAIELTRKELIDLGDKIDGILVGQELFEVHLLLVQDPVLIEDVEKKIRDELVNADYAVSSVLNEVINKFNRISDPYIRERSADIKDVCRRVIEKLLGTEREALGKVNKPVILVARDLDPIDTAGLTRKQVSGFATDVGGKTSHTAILARSYGFPAVVGLNDLAESVQPGVTAIVDGIHGCVVLDPDEKELFFYEELKRKFDETEDSLASLASEPAITVDGYEVELSANIEFSQEADHVRKYGGKGVGLFRTEFLRMISPLETDEETQYNAFVHVLTTLKPDPVIIRTLDLGGDKFLPEFPQVERNPFLGWRAIRICLDHPEVFKKQLRAILRASVYGNARLMVPMITDVNQILQLKSLLTQIKRNLTKEGIPFDQNMPVGIMVETPAAAIAIDLLISHVDFVSIGTNDLTQYTLAVDRGSRLVAKLFDPFHPAVVRQIDTVVKVAHNADKWVGVCGEMAANPLAVPILLGLGVDELSVATTLIPEIKKMIRVINMEDSRKLASMALQLDSGWKIKHLIRSTVAGRYPDILLESNDKDEEF